MKQQINNALKKVRKCLEREGFLVVTDPKLPSVVTEIVGSPIKGSWWGHEKGKVIFNVCGILDDDPDLLSVRLIEGKWTYVHRQVWPEVLSIATAGSPWQTRGLAEEAKKVWKKAAAKSPLDDQDLAKLLPGCKPQDVVKQLENRLLIYTQQMHTASGAHKKVVCSWSHWALQRGVALDKLPSFASAAVKLGDRFADLSARTGKKIKAPWDKG